MKNRGSYSRVFTVFWPVRVKICLEGDILTVKKLDMTELKFVGPVNINSKIISNSGLMSSLFTQIYLLLNTRR